MLSLNIFEKNGTMNQAFRFVQNLASSRHTVGSLGKVLALSTYPVPKAPLIWSKNIYINPTALS